MFFAQRCIAFGINYAELSWSHTPTVLDKNVAQWLLVSPVCVAYCRIATVLARPNWLTTAIDEGSNLGVGVSFQFIFGWWRNAFFLPFFFHSGWLRTPDAGVIAHSHRWGQPARRGPIRQVPSVYYRACEWVVLVCDIALNPDRCVVCLMDLVLFVYSVRHGPKFDWLQGFFLFLCTTSDRHTVWLWFEFFSAIPARSQSSRRNGGLDLLRSP